MSVRFASLMRNASLGLLRSKTSAYVAPVTIAATTSVNGTATPISVSSSYNAVQSRGMAHNPVWLQKETRRTQHLLQLRAHLLQGTLLPKKPVEVRRKERFEASRRSKLVSRHVTLPSFLPVEMYVHNIKNERVGIVRLDRKVFNHEVRKDILQRVVQWQLAGRRAGTHKNLGRSEVRGTTRKPIPQKKSGRARASDLRSPLHYKGGVAMPKRPRDYSYALPHQIRQQGVMVALSGKRKEGKLVILDAAVSETHKSKDLAQNLKEFAANGESVLVIHGNYEEDPNFILAARNIANVDLLPSRAANVVDIIHHRVVILTVLGAAELQRRLTLRKRAPVQVAPKVKLVSLGAYKKKVAQKAAEERAQEEEGLDEEAKQDIAIRRVVAAIKGQNKAVATSIL